MEGPLSTEDIHVAYRVISVMQDDPSHSYVHIAVLVAAAEILRLAYRARTLHDPTPSQMTLSES